MKEDQRRAAALEAQERQRAKVAHKAAEVELKRLELAALQQQRQEAELRKQAERAAVEQQKLEAATARSAQAMAEVKRKQEDAAMRARQRHEEQARKEEEARLNRLPPSGKGGGATADDVLLLSHIRVAAQLVSDERVHLNLHSVYAPLHTEPPSEAALAFAALCRRELHLAFDSALGTSASAEKVAKIRIAHADNVFAAGAINGDVIALVATSFVALSPSASRSAVVWLWMAIVKLFLAECI